MRWERRYSLKEVQLQFLPEYDIDRLDGSDMYKDKITS